MQPTVIDQAAWSISLSQQCCKNGWTHQDDLWVEFSSGPKEPRFTYGFTSPARRSNFEGEEGAAHCKV